AGIPVSSHRALQEGRGGVRRDILQGARAMQLHVNPHELILIGENSFLRLSTDGGQSSSTRCSHWRVLWSGAGAGHALFVDDGGSRGFRIYAKNVPLVRFLKKETDSFLSQPFGDTTLPVLPATFAREGTPPGSCSEIVRSDREEIRLGWSEFLEPFNFAADP